MELILQLDPTTRLTNGQLIYDALAMQSPATIPWMTEKGWVPEPSDLWPLKALQKIVKHHELTFDAWVKHMNTEDKFRFLLQTYRDVANQVNYEDIRIDKMVGLKILSKYAYNLTEDSWKFVNAQNFKYFDQQYFKRYDLIKDHTLLECLAEENVYVAPLSPHFPGSLITTIYKKTKVIPNYILFDLEWKHLETILNPELVKRYHLGFTLLRRTETVEHIKQLISLGLPIKHLTGAHVITDTFLGEVLRCNKKKLMGKIPVDTQMTIEQAKIWEEAGCTYDHLALFKCSQKLSQYLKRKGIFDVDLHHPELGLTIDEFVGNE